MQAQLKTAERWNEKAKSTRELLTCAISAMLKVECCASATHTMDEIDPAGFCMYKGLSGLDCTFPRFVLQHFKHIQSISTTKQVVVISRAEAFSPSVILG